MNVESFRRKAAIQPQTKAGRPPIYATIKSSRGSDISDNQHNDQLLHDQT
jgi:hypothetical protein